MRTIFARDGDARAGRYASLVVGRVIRRLMDALMPLGKLADPDLRPEPRLAAGHDRRHPNDPEWKGGDYLKQLAEPADRPEML